MEIPPKRTGCGKITACSLPTKCPPSAVAPVSVLTVSAVPCSFFLLSYHYRSHVCYRRVQTRTLGCSTAILMSTPAQPRRFCVQLRLSSERRPRTGILHALLVVHHQTWSSCFAYCKLFMRFCEAPSAQGRFPPRSVPPPHDGELCTRDSADVVTVFSSA